MRGITKPRQTGRLGLALFELLLLVYPKRFRKAYRTQLVEAYCAQRNELRYRGVGGGLHLGIELLWDAVGAATRIRRDGMARGAAARGSHEPPQEKDSNARGPKLRDSMLHDIRDAFRGVRRNPVFSTAIIVALAIGIGANVAMFSVTNAALLTRLPFPDADRLVMGRATFAGEVNPSVSIPDYEDYRDRSDAFESLAAIRVGPAGHTIIGGSEPDWATGNYASVNLFHTLGVSPQLGREFSAEEAEAGGPNVAILSHGYWQRRFGGSGDVVGSTLAIDGVPHTVVGVMPAGFHILHDVDFWRPMRRGEPRDSHSWLIIGRLQSGVSIGEAQGQVEVISAQLEEAYPESNEDKALLLTGLQQALGENYRLSLMLLMGAIALVLLIACGNVASLLLARGSARRTELSVRAALGASGRRLARQMFAESLLLAVAAGLLGTVLALWLKELVISVMPLDSLGIREISVSLPVLTFALVLSCGTALVFGGFPAISGARTDPAEHLTNGFRASAGGGTARLRSGLVVVQVAVSTVLLIGSGLLMQSFARLSQVEVGFDSESILTAQLRLPSVEYGERPSRVQFYAGLLEDIEAIPGVVSASAINKLPISDPWMNWGVWDPDNPPSNRAESRSAWSRTVLPGYFETMGIPVRSGRDVSLGDDSEAPRKLVISESMAQGLFPGENPIGRTVAIGSNNPWLLEVVGLVGDARVNMLAVEPGFDMYFPYPQMGYSGMSLVIKTRGEPESIVPAVRTVVLSRDPRIPLAQVITMDDIIADSVSGNRVLNLTLALFAAVAMLLAAIGLYAVLAYDVAKRLPEIGIRVALGATVINVVRLVFSKGLLLVGVGLGLGTTAAVGATRLLQQQLFGVEPTDPATYASVALGFMIVAMLACLVPAIRAVRVDPATAFRRE